MIPTTLLLCLGLLQDPAPVRAEDLAMTTYRVETLDPNDVFLTLQDLVGRSYDLGDRTIQNLSVIYDRILIYDTPEGTAKVLALLEALENDFRSDERSSDPRFEDYQSVGYRLRAMPSHAAVELLQPYMRNVDAQMASGESTSFMTVSIVDGSTLLLRDLPDNLRSMQKLLESLDRPAPQLMLRAWVVQPAADASSSASAAMPAALKAGLDQILPGQTWHVGSHGGVRLSANAFQDLQLALPSGGGVPFHLSLELAAYDAEAGTLSLSRCLLSVHSEELFQTAATIQAQEYAVIGISGSEPVLLVLQMVPLGG